MKRLYSAIIVVGGGSSIPGIVRALEDRVFNRATHIAPDVDRVEVLANRKDLDYRTVTWRGGAVVATLEGAREFWIQRYHTLQTLSRIHHAPSTDTASLYTSLTVSYAL